MDPRNNRRLTALAVFLLCFLFTTWLESAFSEDKLTQLPLTRAKRSTVTQDRSADLQTLLNQGKVPSDPRVEKLRAQLIKKKIVKDTHAQSDSNLKIRRKKGEILYLSPPDGNPVPHTRNENNYIDLSDYHDDLITTLEERVTEIRSKVHKCLPKFICEVHSQSPDKITTDLEKEWINMYSPGMLSDTQHEYQAAAHMGQLFRGYQPSPCHHLYTGCPISVVQLKRFMEAVNDRKKLS
ncbi:hypothetical protein FHG87_017961 [Trinorchestia longiramus]|nr:hypothetical protein FHG87_017961 [Trinorchestia longiramus]